MNVKLLTMDGIARPWVCSGCATSLSQRLWQNSRQPRSNRKHRSYITQPPVQDGRPFRMAVIGSGPAGFYTAYKVMSKIDNSIVDMYEHLPVPFGLVRFGVAPDHPEVKNCQDKFEEVADSPRFNFVGNISIGEHKGALPLRTLMPHYDAILFAFGASQDRVLGIPGENTLHGIYSARAFVGWYNGLPEYSHLAPDLTLGEEAIVIGQGNVALDVARILLQDTSILKSTDITENAILTLQKSKVNRVRVIGRRGPLQAAFTIKEIRELNNLQAVEFEPVDESLMPEDLKSLPRPSRRIMEVLKKGSATQHGYKKWSLDFCLSPKSFNSNPKSPSRLSSISFERTNLNPNPFDPNAQAVGSGEFVSVKSSLAFRSIGYKSEPLPGFAELEIPFDDKTGTIPNDHLGRVFNQSDLVTPRRGMYCAGWVKRGPTGVIASTMADAFQTADSIADDWYTHAPFLSAVGSKACGWDGIEHEAQDQGLRRVSWQDWRRIDAEERRRGKENGKEREKFTSIEDMLAVLD